MSRITAGTLKNRFRSVNRHLGRYKWRVVVIARHRELLEQLGLATPEQVKVFGAGANPVASNVGHPQTGPGAAPALPSCRIELLKDHRGRRDIHRIEARQPNGSPLVLFLKRTWRPYKKDGLHSLLRRGRVWSVARQEWENALALQQAGRRTAELVAYGQECAWGWEKFSFLLTEAAVGTQTVEQFLRACREPQTRRRVLDALAAEVRKLHQAGLATPDLFTRHIFVSADSDPPGFCFIDLARLDRRRRVSSRLAARDLAALNVTAPLRHVTLRERLRFLRVYAGGADRPLRKRVEARTRRLLRRRRFQDFLRNNEPNVK